MAWFTLWFPSKTTESINQSILTHHQSGNKVTFHTTECITMSSAIAVRPFLCLPTGDLQLQSTCESARWSRYRTDHTDHSGRTASHDKQAIARHSSTSFLLWQKNRPTTKPWILPIWISPWIRVIDGASPNHPYWATQPTERVLRTVSNKYLVSTVVPMDLLTDHTAGRYCMVSIDLPLEPIGMKFTATESSAT